MSSANIWVTGAGGFIGRHLVPALAAGGCRVGALGHGVSRGAAASVSPALHLVDGDVAGTGLDALCAAHGRPDRVYHLAGGASVGAAMARPRDDFERTVTTTADLLDWLRREAPDASLVVASSAAVYGAGHEGPIAESASLDPFSPYGHHKAMMESLCRSYGSSYGLRSVIVRLFSVYGTGLRKQLLWDLCSKLAAGGDGVELGGSGHELRDWTHVSDVVRALVRVGSLASAEAPAINVGTGVGRSVESVGAGVVAEWHPGPLRPGLIFDGRSRPGDPFSLIADRRQLDRLGFEWATSVDQGLRDYVRWFRSTAAG